MFDSIGRLGAAAALPQACALCAGPCGRLLVCPACERTLPRLPPCCPHCALPTPGGAACGGCLARPPPWHRLTAAFAYGYPLDRLVVAMKYRGVLAYAVFLAQALASRVADRPDALVAVPLTRARQRERGFNQAQELARRLSRLLGVPVVAGLARLGQAPAQAGSQRTARERNVRAAFVATPSLAGMRVAIVDDVLTTGATLAAAARAVQRAGATVTAGWVVARTLAATRSP